MADWAVKFAIVREDPETDLAVIDRAHAKCALFVASGGCTLLDIAVKRPTLSLEGFDFNPAQIAHTRQKMEAVTRGDLHALCVGGGSENSLNQRGLFEGLFRLLRRAIIEFIAPLRAIEDFFDPTRAIDAPCPPELDPARWFESPYWPIVFELAFHHDLLDAMFTPAATQHAEPGSYPRYFQRVFEDGLVRPGAHRNPFLQHIFLGYYRREDAPSYASAVGHLFDIPMHQGGLLDVPDLQKFDLIHLSNIFDWSSDEVVEAWANALKTRCKPGCHLVIRQLNNRRDLRPFLAPTFDFDEEFGARLQRADRSLFYERIWTGIKRAGSDT